jgi:hypothetical protein
MNTSNTIVLSRRSIFFSIVFRLFWEFSYMANGRVLGQQQIFSGKDLLPSQKVTSLHSKLYSEKKTQK